MSNSKVLSEYKHAFSNINLLQHAADLLQQCSGDHLDSKIAKLNDQIIKLQSGEMKRLDRTGRKLVKDYSY